MLRSTAILALVVVLIGCNGTPASTVEPSKEAPPVTVDPTPPSPPVVPDAPKPSLDAQVESVQRALDESAAVSARAQATLDRVRGKRDAEPATQSPCGNVEVSSAQASYFDLVGTGGEDSICVVTIEAKRSINRIAFNWVFYDASGAKLGERIGIIKDLSKGDREKIELLVRDGTVRIATKSR